jgi:hypothetical protein
MAIEAAWGAIGAPMALIPREPARVAGAASEADGLQRRPDRGR